MPGYGILDATHGKVLPWSWARSHLSKGRNYFLATTKPDGAPHVMPVWGVWLEDRFYFSTGRESRKARNLAANPKCTVSIERSREAVIVEGAASELNDKALFKKFARAYKAKYQWTVKEEDGPIYVVRPRVAFGFIEKPKQFAATATRWIFKEN